MRKAMWSAASVVVLLAVLAPTVRAADTRVAMGSSDDPLAFIPGDVTVPVGGTVEWFNDTDLEHDVQAEDGSFGTPGSDLLGKGGKYEFKFTKAGTFKYFCTPHKSAGMVGTVTVSGTGATTPATGATTTTAAAPGATTTTTARGATTTTTSVAQAGASTTTTTAGLGVTSTTQAAATTPTSAPEGNATTTSTSANATAADDSHGDGEAAADSHGSGDSGKDTNPLAVALVAIATAILGAISIKLLTARG